MQNQIRKDIYACTYPGNFDTTNNNYSGKGLKDYIKKLSTVFESQDTNC